MTDKESRKLIDLFSGAGGFSLGAHLAGFETVLAIDKDKDLSSGYKKNFPNTSLIQDDVESIEPSELLNLAGLDKSQVIGIIGGPPCQGFSYIGKRDPNDPRNNLVYRFFEYVHTIQPSFFVMENVPGLVSEEFSPVLDSGIELIAGQFDVLPTLTLDASDFGAATVRRRIFVIGFRKGDLEKITVEELTKKSVSTKNTVLNAISDLPPINSAKKDGIGEYWAIVNAEPKCEYQKCARKAPPEGLSTSEFRRVVNKGLVSGFKPTVHTERVIQRFSTLSGGEIDKISRARRLSWNDLCPSLRAGTGKDRGSFQALRPIHPEETRVISIREAARIQGFPDWFQFHPTIWHSFRMIGNSVSPYIAKAILSTIYNKTL